MYIEILKKSIVLPVQKRCPFLVPVQYVPFPFVKYIVLNCLLAIVDVFV